ncbi:G patch domain-containing protein 11 [Zeugodacus cucurbitae]|uniref:G patch domain-containing protein 11 n=1 Tax=Zeugodacus cucurbitae TaxID=28588 RepID=UPI0005969C11|nr:G patch domain-containing protein 11 [Zeugodacus cucurbitae]
MSDEDDYMSDKYLCGDVRPSLVQQLNKKRQISLEEKKNEQIKRQKKETMTRKGIVNNKILEESLKKPIEDQNKGFQMLAKMGYKPGQALGKKNTGNDKETRLIEPIGISIKSDRGGLGRETALRDLAERRQQIREQQLRNRLVGGETVTVEQFRKRVQEKADERFAIGALKRCQLTCETLDLENDINEAELCWFWPERNEIVNEKDPDEVNEPNEREVVDDNEEEFTTVEKLEMLTSYLRTSYKFCFWCGVRYKDQDDMNSNCPGEMRDDH